MIIDNTIFYPGKVTYNSFPIDFNIPFSSQLDELNEDLIQVEFDKEFLLDIGWHPERDALTFHQNKLLILLKKQDGLLSH